MLVQFLTHDWSEPTSCQLGTRRYKEEAGRVKGKADLDLEVYGVVTVQQLGKWLVECSTGIIKML